MLRSAGGASTSQRGTTMPPAIGSMTAGPTSADTYTRCPSTVSVAHSVRSRLIFDEGPSLPQADLLRSLVGVDMVITGTVTDYDDPVGEWSVPMVGFSARGIEPERRTVGWTSVSHSQGNNGVFFFDLGKVRTAYELASRMVGQVVVQAMAEQ